MKVFTASLLVMSLVALSLAKPPSGIENIEPAVNDKKLETVSAYEKLQPEFSTREKRGLLYSSAYTSPVAYTAAYRTPIAYTSAYSYPYTYSSAYPYYAAAYTSPYYYL